MSTSQATCIGGFTQEEVLFNTVDLMKPWIDDLDEMEYAFVNVDAQDVVAEDIQRLRDRSCQAMASLFEKFSQSIDVDKRIDEAMRIVLPVLVDQFEVRLRWLAIYWERMKAQNLGTANPDFEGMGTTLQQLTALIQEAGDNGFGKQQSSPDRSDSESLLSAA